ncbi:hypothetical protein BDQ17DRAFT_1355969 [Cyathus striatus]|nr:hypothetical protein BDQ17DRAFT_1355969 [Cyathus striatus]
MNNFPAGTRVFYWAADGQTVYGTVQSSNRTPNGTKFLVIRNDNETIVSMPAVNCNKVQ